MPVDNSAQRREDIAVRLTAAARLAEEPGWEGVASAVITGASDRLDRLEQDDLTLLYDVAESRLEVAEELIDGEFTQASALWVLEHLFETDFDPCGLREPDEESRFESDAEKIARIEASRRDEAGE